MLYQIWKVIYNFYTSIFNILTDIYTHIQLPQVNLMTFLSSEKNSTICSNKRKYVIIQYTSNTNYQSNILSQWFYTIWTTLIEFYKNLYKPFKNKTTS